MPWDSLWSFSVSGYDPKFWEINFDPHVLKEMLTEHDFFDELLALLSGDDGGEADRLATKKMAF